MAVADTEVECAALTHLFTGIVNDLKVVCLPLHATHQRAQLQALSPCWDEVGSRAAKLGASLKVTLQALCSFLDALQRIADRAAANGECFVLRLAFDSATFVTAPHTSTLIFHLTDAAWRSRAMAKPLCVAPVELTMRGGDYPSWKARAILAAFLYAQQLEN